MSKMKRQATEWEKILVTAPAALHPKNKQLNQKMSRGFKQTFLQKRHTDGQQAHGKMLSIAYYY